MSNHRSSSSTARSRLIRQAGSIWLSLWAVGAVSVAAAQGPTIAVVLKVKNEVTHQSAGGAWTAVQPGIQLSAGDRLRTGDDSFAALIFQDDQSVLKVSSRTEVTIDATPGSAGSWSKKLRVDLGAVWAKAKPGEAATFEIETPTSVASVKGSAAYDSVDASGASRLFVEEGRWVFGNQFGSFEVGPGQDGFSDGVNPPVITPTEPGEAPTFARDNPIPGVEPQGQGGDRGETPAEARGEIRIRMRDEAGIERTLIIRYQEEE